MYDTQRGQHTAFLVSCRVQDCAWLPKLLALRACFDRRGTRAYGLVKFCLFQRPCMKFVVVHLPFMRLVSWQVQLEMRVLHA